MVLRARSTTTSMSSVQAPVDRYFQPPSADTTTITPDLDGPAHLAAPAMAAPVEIPANTPTSASFRVQRIDCRGDDGLAVEQLLAAELGEDGRDVAVVQVPQPVHHLPGRGLDGPHLDGRVLLLQEPAHPEQRPRRAEPGHEVGDLGTVPPDLGPVPS
jgi:hypothetical protein